MKIFQRAKTKPVPKPVSELDHITTEMYKKNRELSDRNATLSLLRKIDEIVLSSVTDTKRVANQVAEAVIQESDLALIAIYKVTGQTLTPYAIVHQTGDRTPEHELVDRALGNGLKLDHLSALAHQGIAKGHMQPLPSQRALFPVRAKSHAMPDHVAGLGQVYLCPLMVREELIGLMMVAAKQSQKGPSLYQINLIARLTGVISIAFDSSLMYEQLKATTSSLRLANRNLKALDHAKDEFISMASHQLRTPLTTIEGYLSMLRDGDAGPLTDRQKEFLDYTMDGAVRMVNLISDMLNVSRMSAGKFMVNTQPVDLLKTTEDEVKHLIAHAAAKGLKLELVRPKQPLPLMRLDEGKTRQVIMNFIDNAIYYTKSGKVTVKLEATPRAVTFSVKDTGIGVAPADQKKLFTKFYRAANAQTVRPDGTGLGLYLAKRVIEEQGGKLVFSSQLNKGSIFGFALPITLAALPA